LAKDNTIYYLKYDDILDKETLNFIYMNEECNYYFSDKFDIEFYIQLARCGFISTSIIENDEQYLLPEMQFEYALLDFENLVVSKSINKLLEKNNYKFSINTKFNEVLEKLDSYHEINWLSGKYRDIIIDIYNSKNNEQIEILSVELSNEKDELITAEIGYIIGKTYTSLTGFSSKEKSYKNWGKLQMVLLGKYLEKEKFDFWNLGHPYMQYKFDLGALKYSRIDFLKRWLISINK
jgi:Leu/Phe-tRNA-protein transferase